MTIPDYLKLGSNTYDRVRSNKQLYQIGDDFQVLGKARDCASIGCPGVMILNDAPDTKLTKYWQFHIYAINSGMSVNAISSLWGDKKALTNEPEGNARNYLTDEGQDKEDPNLDKLRTFGLNTHMGYDDGVYVYIYTMDGNLPPLMKIDPATGKRYKQPETLSEIDSSKYFYNPKDNPEMFLDCNNVQWKTSSSGIKYLAYGPFAHGVLRDWINDNTPHTFFPLVSRYAIIKSLKSKWNKLPLGAKFPSAFRR